MQQSRETFTIYGPENSEESPDSYDFKSQERPQKRHRQESRLDHLQESHQLTGCLPHEERAEQQCSLCSERGHAISHFDAQEQAREHPEELSGEDLPGKSGQKDICRL